MIVPHWLATDTTSYLPHNNHFNYSITSPIAKFLICKLGSFCLIVQAKRKSFCDHLVRSPFLVPLCSCVHKFRRIIPNYQSLTRSTHTKKPQQNARGLLHPHTPHFPIYSTHLIKPTEMNESPSGDRIPCYIVHLFW